MKLLLKLLAPWFAVGICWCVFKNGWMAILAYHAQILFWNKTKRNVISERVPSVPGGLAPPSKKSWLLTALPCAVAGPLVYFLLPYMAHTNIENWLAEYHLTGRKLLFMIPYFGIVHPMLEQLHWTPLREQSRAAHFFFAGYHVLVLFSLVTVPWLIFCFFALTAASFAWQWLTQKSDSQLPSTLSHILIDLGMILTVAWIVSG